MRRAKKITAFAVAAAMVFSNVAYAAPGTTTSSVTSESGAESEESLNSQSGASEGTGDQASDQGTSGTESSAGETEETSTKNTTTDASGQSETQETKNEDQGSQATPAQSAETQKSEDEQKDSGTKEEAKVLYDINFVTPEKHGKVTDMNGSEVADGKTLKTDENGKVQFKVKADDGYQVSAVYQMPNEQTPLKLVKDSYYELQVDKNTTVKVVYQKIPEEKKDGEDADSDAEEPKEDEVKEEAGAEKNDQQSEETETSDSSKKEETNGKISMKAMLAANPDEMVKVTIKGTNQDGTREISVGNIADNAPVIEGYEFVNAKVEDTIVSYLGVYNGTTYYATEADNLSGVELGNSEVILYYQPKVTRYQITYDYNKSAGEVTGVKEIREGETLRVLVTPNKGYEISSVEANNHNVNPSSDGVYEINDINKDQTIKVTFNEVKEYNVYIDNLSNAKLKYGTQTFYADNKSSFNYDAGSKTISFTLTTNEAGQEFELNSLNLQIGELENKNIKLPGDDGEDNSSISTTLDDGTVVTVRNVVVDQKVKQYSVTITNTNGLFDDMHLKINCKDISFEEVWFQELTGVAPVLWYGKNKQNDETGVIGQRAAGEFAHISDKSNGIFSSFDGYHYFYVKVLDGYDSDSLKLKVFGVEDQDVSLKPITKGLPGYSDAVSQGYTHYFRIYNNSSISLKNVRVFLSADYEKYHIKYDYDGGKIDDDTEYVTQETYSLVQGESSFSVGSGLLPKKSGYTFQGWKLGDTIYKTDEIFTLTENNVSLATEDQIVFHAVWEENDESEQAPYTIQFEFEQPDGDFKVDPEKTQIKYGKVGDTAFVMQENAPKFEGYELAEKNYSEVIKAGSETTITLHYEYKQLPYTIYYHQDSKESQAFYTSDGTVKWSNKKVSEKDIQEQITEHAPQGYKWDKSKSTGLPYTVSETDNAIHIVYVKDQSQWFNIEYESGTTDKVTGMPETSSQEVLAGTYQRVNSEAKPKRSGYEFAGWKTNDVELGQDGSFTMPENDVT